MYAFFGGKSAKASDTPLAVKVLQNARSAPFIVIKATNTGNTPLLVSNLSVEKLKKNNQNTIYSLRLLDNLAPHKVKPGKRYEVKVKASYIRTVIGNPKKKEKVRIIVTDTHSDKHVSQVLRI